MNRRHGLTTDKKKNKDMKIKFSFDDLPLDFGDAAFLSIITQEPDYVMADNLNRLYDLHLVREDDLMPFGYPYYVSKDASHAPLEYRLVQITGSDRGFLLVVTGSERARSVVMQMEEEFNTMGEVADPHDLLALERQEILDRYRQNLTLVNMMTFTEEELEQAARPGRRARKGRVALADLYARIMDAIDLAS